MKRLSIRLRFTLITTLLTTLCCVVLNILIMNSAIMKLDNLEAVALDFSGKDNQDIKIELGMSDLFPDIINTIAETKHDFTVQAVIFTILIVIIGALLAWFFSGAALKPVRDLSRIIADTTENNLTKEIEVSKANDEISLLTESFNKMKLKLNDAFQSQKQFTANAAHELRTPLAVMMTNLEVFIKKQNKTEKEYNEYLVSSQKQINRLNKLVNSLLELLSMHTAQLNDEIEIVSLTDEIICDLDSVAQNNNISIEFNPQSDSITLKNKGNEVLIYRAIYNIIENAIKYNSENGRVIVTISEENGKSVIRVEDNGKGISKEEQKKIFEPFYRVDKSRSRSLGGYGIGLAMVSEIMDIHGGAIELEKSDENGSIFCLVL